MTDELEDVDLPGAGTGAAGPSADDRLPLPGAALFDLDGTLVDSVPDITAAVAELLAAEQLPPLREDQVRLMIGRGLKVLVRRVYDARGLALDEASLEHRLEAMRDIYPRHLVGGTTLMPGVRPALEFLRAHRCAMAVVTNKPVAATETILEHFGLRGFFAAVIGDSTEPPLSLLARKPQPDMLIEAMRRLGRGADETVMVGDSGVDIRAARAAGVRALAVRGGYCAEPLESFAPDAVLGSLAELPARFRV